jgi:hypothetical protein
VVLFVMLANKLRAGKVTLPESALRAYMPKKEHCGHDKVLHQLPLYKSPFGLVIKVPITCGFCGHLGHTRCASEQLPSGSMFIGVASV